MLLLFFCLGTGSMAHASSDLNLNQIQEVFRRAIASDDNSVTFQTSTSYNFSEIQERLQKAALANSKICSGPYRYQKLTKGASVTYTVYFSGQTFEKVTILKSRNAARKAAVKALKNSSYSKKFYSKTSYVQEFMNIMKQHPEYNYDTSVWHATDHTYGYHRSKELTEYEQTTMMSAAEQEAENIARRYVLPEDTARKKYRAIHNYLIRNCAYNYTAANSTRGFDVAFTAYGALVRHSAVCQGYAGAFDLIAKKAGLRAMTVSGSAGGQKHAWNYVKIGNTYRYIDCTWDDTDGGDSDRVIYQYFLISRSEIAKDHYWKPEDFPKKFFNFC